MNEKRGIGVGPLYKRAEGLMAIHHEKWRICEPLANWHGACIC